MASIKDIVTRFKKAKKKVTDVTGDVISAPSRIKSSLRGEDADTLRRAVRLSRETKRVYATPDTEFGRDVITARGLSHALKKKRGLKTNY